MRWSLLLHPILLLLEATLLTTRRMKNLLVSYGLAVVFLSLRLKWASPTFSAIWQSMFLFQLFRAIAFGTGIVWQPRTRRPRHDGPEDQAAPAAVVSAAKAQDS
ncbi:hypothetical protein ACA910_008402 [Epithemia clementina (nom. ined.)]